MEREVGGGIGMGNTCKSMADSFQCMAKSTTIKIKKQRYYCANKVPSGQVYGFSSGHVWMRELDCDES